LLLLPQAGILAADKVLTVSPNYAAEIGSGPDKGVELDSVIRMVSTQLIAQQQQQGWQ
jgi:granule-bound starch synthase